MNQLDWERMQEDVKISNVTLVPGGTATTSSWFVAQSEYRINKGSLVNGTYTNTLIASDGSWETFQEEKDPPKKYELDINGTFVIDVSLYPLSNISTIEIQVRYRASDANEKWLLKAYNWTSGTYSFNGFNSTLGHTPTTGWDYYAVNLTNQWRSYVRSDGTMYVKFLDEGEDNARTIVDIDFFGVRVVGIANVPRFTFKNTGSVTAHLVSLWIISSATHQRYDLNLIVNSGETLNYTRTDINLGSGSYVIKIVTERGNKATYTYPS